MSEDTDRDAWASSPLAGLRPTRVIEDDGPRGNARHRAPRERVAPDFGRASRSVLATMPILLVGTLAMSSVGLIAATPATDKHKDSHDEASDTTDLTAVADALAAGTAKIPSPTIATGSQAGDVSTASVVVPKTYTVKKGDTVSGIANRYKLSTPAVLSLNGLKATSLIFPGQVLKLVKATTTKPTAPSTGSGSSSGSTSTGSSTSGGTTTTTKPTPPKSTTYTIKAGDTVTSIAKKFAVTVQAILTANNLKVTSIIYTGRSLVIPATGTTTTTTGGSTSSGSTGSSSGGSSSGGSSSGGTTTAGTGTTTTPLSPTMKTNALTIISVGQKLNVPSYGIIIALATAMQESGLQNLSSGDLDSVGLFQQRPSTGWGTKAQLENTTYAAELFYGGPSNPNKGKTRGLLDIPGWQQMTLTQAAQAVQISGSPNAYAKWQASATAWYAQLT